MGAAELEATAALAAVLIQAMIFAYTYGTLTQQVRDARDDVRDLRNFICPYTGKTDHIK